ncbi:class I SAM-dependent methyltransferase [Nocardia jinanensis]|uniref:Methyltransferase type 11 n=1 Tax=Nocardia jinanensis TaxID=382504 RepID=A0A917R6F8_9NOCA|nr:class I SAM-dependent methyltransferase [Nocardia jinanensis]GGK91800.1 methyltransferase type 11 [Nocardia jinanensis]
MVTLPLSDPTPHSHREIAESFGIDADRYDRARPRYPQALVDTVLADLPGRSVLDVGIGTGISALPLRAAGATVRGVEVDPRMAELARSRGFEVEVSRFEDWESGTRVFDAVIAGQTWHWIDPVAGAAKAAGLVRPGGRLALFWNVGDPDPEIASAFAGVYRSVDTGLPFTPWSAPALNGYDAIAAPVIDGIRASGAFGEPVRPRFDWQATITRAAWLDQVPTMGGHNRIPEDRLTELLTGLARVVDDHGGSFTMNYATIAIIADRTAA